MNRGVITGALSPDGTQVTIGSEDGLLYALSPADGHILWTFQSSSAVSGDEDEVEDDDERMMMSITCIFLFYFLPLVPNPKIQFEFTSRCRYDGQTDEEVANNPH